MLISLQILRGAAAWVIVYNHIIQSYYRDDLIYPVFSVLNKVAPLGVDIFFVLSGFVMALTAPKYNAQGIRYGINRFLRVMPTYWFYTIILIISVLCLPEGSYLTEYTADTLLQSVFLIPHENPNGYGNYPFLYVGWTLSYEMFFYMILSCVLLFNFKQPIWICSFILIGIAFSTYKIDFLGHSSFLLLEFIAGMWMYLYTQKFSSWKMHGCVFMGILLGAGLTYVLVEKNSVLIGLFASVFVVFLFILCESLFQKFQQFFLFFCKLGDYSYSTYLCHIVVIGWFYAVFSSKNLDVFENILLVGGITLTVLILSFASYHLVENNMFVHFLRQTVKKRYKK